MARYLIGGIVVFDSDLYEMSRTDAPEEVFQLGAASSRCLQVLLEAKGGIVTKNDLLYQGWEQYKNIVTGNSINQAIAQIRKGLALLHMDPQGIVTVPRVGYKISDDLAVQKMEGAEVPVELPAEFPASVPAAPRAGEVGAAVPQRQPESRKAWRLPLLAALNLAVAVGVWNFLDVGALKGAPQIAYEPVKRDGEINYFAPKEVEGGPAHVEGSIAMLRKRPPGGISVATNNFIYINGARRDNVYSYFLCQRILEESDSRCISYLILVEAGQS